MSKTVTLDQAKGGIEQLGDKALRERLRPLVPQAIENIKKLMKSKNEGIAFGANKLVISKFVPDIKVTELRGDEDRPLGVVILPPLENDDSVASPSRAADNSTPEERL